MTRLYFVSYRFTDSDDSGFGMAQVERDAPIRDMEDVKEIKRALEYDMVQRPPRRLTHPNVTVLNWQRFEKEEQL